MSLFLLHRKWHWLALLAVALWPTWWWMGQRMVDGSDDPLGVLALAALAALLYTNRDHLSAAPRPGDWGAERSAQVKGGGRRPGDTKQNALPPSLLCLQVTALVGAVLTTALHNQLPDLVVALIGLLSMAAGLLAFLPARVARSPVWGLAVLSLPLLASLQFYAGFPLRVITAEVSRCLLGLFFTVERSGSSLVVDGQLIMVDAPCSGVQMVWLGYFTACVVALATQRSDRAFWLRLPVVSTLVLLGNVLRNTLLVSAQASGVPMPGWGHDAVGLVVLALVCTGIAWVMAHRGEQGPADAHRAAHHAPHTPLQHHFLGQRALRKALWASVLPACALWGIGQAVADHRAHPHAATQASTAAVELPAQWQGKPLRPLALSEVEQRFASHFPGSVARMTDGNHVLVLRTVTQPTRMLHPATDCYRGLGYRIHREQLEVLADQQRWRCFVAQRASRAVRVCERIEDAQGQGYTDTSAWYWASVAGQSRGPWQAVTVATPL